ncbi:CHAT domain-containing protein [uncultured Winogradskyella sp.]|uniref:CHAT domain-containing protein n=1 Tax=uncultured Winogradskyella sp. TaxID=395353 RepID=UPI0026041BE4|nr:CHAT domain-containing protein [uncultured Winogradskyella sp.]
MTYFSLFCTQRLFTLLFILNLFFVNAQQNDSLKITDLENGKELLFYGKYNESVSVFQKVLENFKSSKDYSKIAETYNLLSQAYFSNSRLDEALLSAQIALENSRKNDLKSNYEEANALDNIGNAQTAMGKFKEALTNYNLALNIRLQYIEKDNYGLVSSYYNLGTLFRSKGEFESALNYLNKALNTELKKTKKNKILQANNNEAMGFVYYDLSDFDTALSYFETMLDLSNEVYENNNPYFVKVYNNLGLIYSIKEQFNQSLEYYQKAIGVSINNYGVDRHPDQAKLNFNIGTIYRRQNQKSKALYHTKKSLDMALKVFGENHRNLFFPYSQIGQIYNDEKGIFYLMKALKICNETDKLRISYLYDYLYEAHTNVGNYSEALIYAKKALQIREDVFGENNVNIVRSNNIVSKSYMAVNDNQNALDQINKAINSNYLGYDRNNILAKTIKLTDFLDDDLLLESIKIKADIYLSLYNKEGLKEQLEESNLLYKKANSLINIKRNKKRNYDDKIKFSGIVKSIYAKNIETQLLLSKSQENKTSLDELFYFSEKSRANVLRELAKNTDAKNISHINTEILELENHIDTEIAKLTSNIIDEASKKQIDSSKAHKLEGNLFDLKRRKDSLETQIETDYPKYYELKYEKNIIEIYELQKQLEENTTFIEFFTSKNNVYVFIITKDNFHVEKLLIENLNEKIETLNESITSKEEASYISLSSNLYEQLIKPIRKHIIGNKLIIVPDESLWHLQFDLLITSNETKTYNQPNYLLFDYAISYANSASMLFENTKGIIKNDLLDECIAFSYTSSNSISNTTDIDLPGSRKEIKELSTIFKGKYLYGDQANETNFKNNVNYYKLVHLALHAKIDSLNPKHLKIFFSETEQDEKEDNILYGHELYNVNIPADLVVLSACNTGVGKINKGEGILSLGNAFQYAGAKSLMLSRWEISDETTPEVMKLFYTNIKSGMNKSVALQQAKINYLSSTDILRSSPYYWGSFYILGDTNAVELSNSSSYMYYYMGAFIVLIIFIILFRRKK